MPNSLPIVTRTGDREVILLPRRANRGWFFLLAFPFALPFLGVATLFAVGFFFPSVLHSKPTFSGPFLARPVGYLIAALFCAGFYLIGGWLVLGTLIYRFGRGEIHLWPGHIRTYSRMGFLRLWRTHRLDTLTRLAIRPNDGGMPLPPGTTWRSTRSLPTPWPFAWRTATAASSSWSSRDIYKRRCRN